MPLTFAVGAPAPRRPRAHAHAQAGTACVCCASPPRAASRTTPLLRLEDVRYVVPMDEENVVFHSLNLALYRRELIVLTGHNGCGKSTLLQLLCGLLEPDSGATYWCGEALKPDDLLQHVGVVMQSPGDYFFTRTVLDELVLGRDTRTPDDVRRVMADVGLNNISLLARPRRLSGGQTRRLAIASQLMRDPEPQLIVLDEPLVGVDWMGRADIVRLLGELRHRFAVVIVSHEPVELLPYADRVVQIARGEAHEVPREVIDRALYIQQAREARGDPHAEIKRLMQS